MSWKLWRSSSYRLASCTRFLCKCYAPLASQCCAKCSYMSVISLWLWQCHTLRCLLDAQVEASIESLLARQQHLQGQREQLCRKITLNSRAPKADWQGTFAWDQEVDHLLHSSFALQNFRSSSAGALFKHMHMSLHYCPTTCCDPLPCKSNTTCTGNHRTATLYTNLVPTHGPLHAVCKSCLS